MRKYSGRLLGLASILALFAVHPALAAVTALSKTFSITCDGTNKTVTLKLGGFESMATQSVLGGTLSIQDNRNNLKYLTAATTGGGIFVAAGERGAGGSTMFPGLAATGYPASGEANATIKVVANSAGQVAFTINGNCAGVDSVSALLVVFFLTTP